MTNDQLKIMTNDECNVAGDVDPWENKVNNGDTRFREEPVYDLAERTAKFGEAIIRFAKKIPQNAVNARLMAQLVGCGTSVGANYCEADDAVSKKEFICKIGTCRKEARESKFFLRMAVTAEPALRDEARELWLEAKELHLIFCKIFQSGRKPSRY